MFVFGRVLRNEDPLTFIAEENNSTIYIEKHGRYVVANTIFYRTSTNTKWAEYSLSTIITLNNIGDFVQFKATGPLSFSSRYYVSFVMTGKIHAEGDIQSLLNYSNECTDWCFYSLFYNCISLTSIPRLSAKVLAPYCYYLMFYNCTSLTYVESLPATTLAQECYHNMFAECLNLISGPTILPAMTLANSCYWAMFDRCVNLNTTPILPATTLADACYRDMFRHCEHLEKAPILPATALVEDCYNRMFLACYKLNYIHVNFSSWNPISATASWVDSVNSTGTFECPNQLEQTFNKSHIPQNWEVVTF